MTFRSTCCFVVISHHNPHIRSVVEIVLEAGLIKRLTRFEINGVTLVSVVNVLGMSACSHDFTVTTLLVVRRRGTCSTYGCGTASINVERTFQTFRRYVVVRSRPLDNNNIGTFRRGKYRTAVRN
jgi:hypothetical protein